MVEVPVVVLVDVVVAAFETGGAVDQNESFYLR